MNAAKLVVGILAISILSGCSLFAVFTFLQYVIGGSF